MTVVFLSMSRWHPGAALGRDPSDGPARRQFTQSVLAGRTSSRAMTSLTTRALPSRTGNAHERIARPRGRAAVPCRASGGTRRPPAGSQPPDLYGVPAYPAVTVPIEGGGPKEGGCTTAIVTYDNERAPCATIINVSCLDYPGLLRTIAWVLRGLDLRVEHCILDTNANMAEDTFWVMDSKGRKLSDKAAEGVCDRIGDYVSQCFPATSAEFKTLRHGSVVIDNQLDKDFSVILVGVGEGQAPMATSGYVSDGMPSIAEIEVEDLDLATMRGDLASASFVCGGDRGTWGALDPAAFLLDVASAVSGAGLLVQKAVLLQWDKCDARTKRLLTAVGAGTGKMKVFKLWVNDARGSKLDFSSASGVLYTLDLILKSGVMVHNSPTSPPGASFGVGVRF